MAEKLAFHQLSGNCPAVDRHKTLAGTRALLMDQPGDQLLAATRFPADVDRRLTASEFFDLFAHVVHRRGVAQQTALNGRRWDGDRRQAQRAGDQRSEEHTSELQSLMRISYAVFCLKKN